MLYGRQDCNRANIVHKPRLLSDNGSSYVSGDLAEWLEDQRMDHVRGAPYAEHRGGAARSRVEGPVMGLDRRGCIVQPKTGANWQQEEPWD